MQVQTDFFDYGALLPGASAPLSLLEQYKNIIDESVIVSKSDKAGIITYANAEFCKISGYSLDELIGKPHNIIRHPDIDKSVFRDMWKTIQSGHIWRGTLKNRAKNGSVYWVKATINPIFDSNGEIVEYIAVRDDITEMMEIKERLQTKLNMAGENILELFTLAQDYEKAIEESNIVTRTDLNGAITYANHLFCDVTGYSQDELYGKTHSLITNAKRPKAQVEALWRTLHAGGIFKGIIRDSTKHGDDIWLDTTITPITDKNGNPREYMAIRHDVSSLIKLQRDFERTQRDILCRLGEVGESRSKETGYHVKRVAEYARTLAKLAHVDSEDIKILYAAAPMHDIGKIGIADSILLKPGPLDADEFKTMQQHTTIGFSILQASKSHVMQAAATICAQHHEKHDGSGYPYGLRAQEIHLFSRITAIADVFDALASERPYKHAWALEEIFAYFEAQKNKQFDGALVELFLANKECFIALKNTYKD